jgi:hypothetical protein
LTSVEPPTGTVTFLSGSSVLAQVPLAGGSAAWTTSTLTAGKHEITARYNGDPYYQTTDSAPLTQTVNWITLFAVGAAPGRVIVFDPSHNPLVEFVPFGMGYDGHINVAVGDVTGDGYYDLVTAAAAGNPHVKVYDGKALTSGWFNTANADAYLVASFFPYALEYNVGSNIAVGDVDGDGFAEIVTGANMGNPHVKLFAGADIANGNFQPDGASLMAQWFPYALQFNVGANVAVGDVTGDGLADVVTGANMGNPHIKVYGGSQLLAGADDPERKALLADWFAYAQNFNVGASVAVGDVAGSGYAAVITGATVGNPHVRVFNGAGIGNGLTTAGTEPQELDSFFAYDLNFNVGANVGAADFDGDGKADVLTGASVGSPHYRVVKGDATGTLPPAIFEGLPTNLHGGVAVAA